jgi:S-layer protein
LVNNGSLNTLTGGAGADTFDAAFAVANVNSYASITDLAAGDKIMFAAGAATFQAAGITLAGTAVFQDFANAAINATNPGAVAWFQFGGDTYVIENVSDAASFLNGTDIIVKVVGLVDLSTASFSASADTLLIV